MTRWLDGIAILVWNLFAWALWAAAVIQLFCTPASRFTHGWRTKLSRLVVISVLSIVIAGLFLPFGAAAILVGLRRTARQTQPVAPAAPRGPQLP